MIAVEYFFRAYLIGWLFIWGLSLGSLALIMIHHLTGGAWGIVLRRRLEAQMRLMPLMALLFIPIALGAEHLFPWARSNSIATGEIHRFAAAYFRPEFVWSRAASYFAVWIVLAWLLSRWSWQEDESGAARPASLSNNISGSGLVLYGISLHFAAIDWMMSIQWPFTSTIIGPIVAAGQLLSALACAIGWLSWNNRQLDSEQILSGKVLLDLGNLLLTLVIVWTYLVWWIWLDPEKLHSRSVTANDVVNTLREQNVQVAAGRIGQPPSPANQQLQLTVTTVGRLSDPEQFGEIVLKTGQGHRVTFLRDVATIELGAQVYDQFSEQTGQPSANVLVYQLPGSNALQVADRVEAAMKRLGQSFPPDLAYKVPFDTTRFVRAAVHDVYETLFEAGILVLVVIVVFLQDWRAVLVPATTVPVTIVGAFAFLYALGFTVNLLTLFGLVLAIGIVVDDAIVIVENAAHHIEQGMPPREATIKAMNEVTGPVIAITLVLLAVFLPAAFLQGITGQLYRQFALTIAATALISAINALTLKPAQSAAWLRRPKQHKNFLSRSFNAFYGRTQDAYVWLVHRVLKVPALMLVAFVALMALAGWWYVSLPTGFLPAEDQGYVIINAQLPDAASLERTRAVVKRLDKILKQTPGVEEWFVLGGLSMLDASVESNAATAYAIFKPWDQRTTREQSQDAILAHLSHEFYDIAQAATFAMVPPPIRGLGVGGGFQMEIEDRENVGLAELQDRLQDILQDAAERPELAQVNSTFRATVPQIFLDINRVKAKTAGVPLTEVFSTLEDTLGSAYVNDFNKFGRTFQVRVQAASRFRTRPDDIARLDVRNARGEMVPMGTLARVERIRGPQVITRYNLFPAAMITGSSAPGYSSGQALAAMQDIAGQRLPPSMGFEWTGVAFQEQRVSSQAVWVFAMAVLLVYLVLAAQYENWLLPLAVILVVPLGLLGAVAAVAARGFNNNIYTQVGIVLIIALASKNAILIVEFARELRLAGRSIVDAAAEAARLRFRPIVMTSFAFILGVAPLVFASGAGAVSRQSLGTVVFGGMIASTLLAVFFVPVFFVVMQALSEWFGATFPRHAPPATDQPHPAPPD